MHLRFLNYSESRVKMHYTYADWRANSTCPCHVCHILTDGTFRCFQECLATGFRFSVTHDDPPFGQSEPHDECNSSGDDTIVQPQQNHHQQDHGGNHTEKPVTCDYLSPYAFTARNSLGSTSGTCKADDKPPMVKTASENVGKMLRTGYRYSAVFSIHIITYR